MALFTSKADQGLPLATQFYQLRFDYENLIFSEIDAWVANWIKNQPDRTTGKEITIFSDRSITEFYFSDDSSNKDLALKGLYKHLENISKFHPIFCSLMDVLESRINSDYVLENIEEYTQIYLSAPTIIYNSFENRYETGRFKNDIIIPDLLLEVIDSLEREKSMNIKLFNKCKECSNTFLGTKGNQMFCSHRCADRVSARKKRLA